MKRITPIKAIRKKCLDCSGFELKNVRECLFDGKRDDECALYPFRMGKGGRKGLLKKIRAYCLWCCLDQRNEVKLCPSVSCPLWEFRFGRRPRLPQECLSLSEIGSTEGVLEAVRS